MTREALDAFLEKSKIFRLLDEEGRERLGRIAQEIDHPAGSVIKLELQDGDRRVHVETTRDHYAALAHPLAGERLYVKPRQVRVFVESEAAAG